jgi:hypothetical protein
MDDAYDILIKYEFNPGHNSVMSHQPFGKKEITEMVVTSFLQEQINGVMRCILLLTVIKFS